MFIKILLNLDCQFFTPKFIFVELFKHKSKIQKFSSLSEEEILELLRAAVERIKFISLDEVEKESVRKSYKLCKENPSDAPFVALSLFLGAKLWTGDKKLCSLLLRNGIDLCVSMQELLKFCSSI